MITARSALLLAARITALFGRLKTDFMVSSCNKPDWGYFRFRPRVSGFGADGLFGIEATSNVIDAIPSTTSQVWTAWYWRVVRDTPTCTAWLPAPRALSNLRACFTAAAGNSLAAANLSWSICVIRAFSIVVFCELKCCGFLRVIPTMEGDVSEHGAPGVKSNSNN